MIRRGKSDTEMKKGNKLTPQKREFFRDEWLSRTGPPDHLDNKLTHLHFSIHTNGMCALYWLQYTLESTLHPWELPPFQPKEVHEWLSSKTSSVQPLAWRPDPSYRAMSSSPWVFIQQGNDGSVSCHSPLPNLRPHGEPCRWNDLAVCIILHWCTVRPVCGVAQRTDPSARDLTAAGLYP